MNIPDGIRTESTRNSDRNPQDSALSQPASQSIQPAKLPPTARERAQAPATNATETKIRLREIHHLDALAIAITSIRPDWAPDLVRAVLARTPASLRDLTRHALECALDPDIHHPARIENLDRRAYEPTPVPPSLEEWRNAKRCDDHGEIVGKCALCRHGIGGGA